MLISPSKKKNTIFCFISFESVNWCVSGSLNFISKQAGRNIFFLFSLLFFCPPLFLNKQNIFFFLFSEICLYVCVMLDLYSISCVPPTPLRLILCCVRVCFFPFFFVWVSAEQMTKIQYEFKKKMKVWRLLLFCFFFTRNAPLPKQSDCPFYFVQLT